VEQHSLKITHDKNAPYWAVALVIFCIVGLSTNWINLGDFWKGYVLDMTGPAWNYILFRGLFTAKVNNAWTRFFTPNKTLIIFLLVCFLIEILQYFKIYDSTFDPWDLLAYGSILIPIFLLDLILIKQYKKYPN
jgi:4-amino-4-deoxy-L-arabinose transferase-like glycosyltransferase